MDSTPSPRNLPDVIDAMLAVIPVDQQNLRHCLANAKQSSCYAPPENQHIWWQETQGILAQLVGEPKLDWQWQVAAAFAGKPVDELKQGWAQHPKPASPPQHPFRAVFRENLDIYEVNVINDSTEEEVHFSLTVTKVVRRDPLHAVKYDVGDVITVGYGRAGGVAGYINWTLTASCG